MDCRSRLLFAAAGGFRPASFAGAGFGNGVVPLFRSGGYSLACRLALAKLHRGGWVCRYDLATAVEQAINLPTAGYQAFHVVGSEEARAAFEIERTERAVRASAEVNSGLSRSAPRPLPERPQLPERPTERPPEQPIAVRSTAPKGGLSGLDPEIAARLQDAGYTSLESMDEEDEERLARAADLTLDEAREVKRKVRRQLAQEKRSLR